MLVLNRTDPNLLRRDVALAAKDPGILTISGYRILSLSVNSVIFEEMKINFVCFESLFNVSICYYRVIAFTKSHLRGPTHPRGG